MTNFTLWPEEPVPHECVNCTKCGLDQHGTRMVWGEGNPTAPVIILLDNPGLREDRDQKPFVCGTRQTLQLASHEVGLKEEDLYVTYVLKRKPTRAYEKERTREICMEHFNSQLAQKQPLLILCLGNVSVQSFFQDEAVDVKSLRGRIHHIQGFPTAVAYHPLAVRRRPNLWQHFAEDWKLVAETIKKG